MQVLKDSIYQQILVASGELFLRKGYQLATMEKIAARAGISKSNLYNYFKSKEEIFYRLTDMAALKIKDLIEGFQDMQVDWKTEGESFASLLSQRISALLTSERQGLLLLLGSSKGTRYENITEQLIDVFARKFAGEIRQPCEAPLLAHVVACSLITGIITILKHGGTDAQIRDNIRALAKYHTGGSQSLFY